MGIAAAFTVLCALYWWSSGEQGVAIVDFILAIFWFVDFIVKVKSI